MPYSRHQKLYHRGFTLLELIMVVAILGVLAVLIMPAINKNAGYGNTFFARGFHDETLALLRFGQKSAIAQRRTVCVEFSGTTGVTLTIAETAAAPTCGTNLLQGPKGGAGLGATVTAKPGVAYSTALVDFNYDGLGRPVDGSGALVDRTIQVVNAAKFITVEKNTGYTYD